MNEELQTVNSELKDQARRASLHRPQRSEEPEPGPPRSGTLFLDNEAADPHVHPPMADLFSITRHRRRPADQPISPHRLRHDGIEEEARRVLRDLTPRGERGAEPGRALVHDAQPTYRTVEDRIEGVGADLRSFEVTRAPRDGARTSGKPPALRDAVQLDRRGLLHHGDHDRGRRESGRTTASSKSTPPSSRQTGLKDAVGKAAREMVPDHESTGSSATRGSPRPARPNWFEAPAKALGRYYEV